MDLAQCANPSISWENLWIVSLQSWRKLQWAFTQDFVCTTCTRFSGERSANVVSTLLGIRFLLRKCECTVVASTNVYVLIQPHFQKVCPALGSIFRDGVRGPCSSCPATCRSSHTALESVSLIKREVCWSSCTSALWTDSSRSCVVCILSHGRRSTLIFHCDLVWICNFLLIAILSHIYLHYHVIVNEIPFQIFVHLK